MTTRSSSKLPQHFNPNRPPDVLVRDGVRAARSVRRGEVLTHHIALGFAFQVGRRWSMAEARTNRPEGKNYNETFSRWLAANPPLDDIKPNTRANCTWLADNWVDVQAFLATVDVDRLQSMGSNGLRSYVERAQRDRRPPAASLGPRPPRQPTELERALAWIDTAKRAMSAAGVILDDENEMLLLRDKRLHESWRKFVQDEATGTLEGEATVEIEDAQEEDDDAVSVVTEPRIISTLKKSIENRGPF
jgi:hypothetical protein